jgi:hypothetical protein
VKQGPRPPVEEDEDDTEEQTEGAAVAVELVVALEEATGQPQAARHWKGEKMP